MSLKIFTNLSSQNSQRAMSINSARLGSALERIATGIRLQRSGDDIGAMAVSESLRGDVTALRQGAKNLNDGISLINDVESGLGEQSGILIRLRELASVAGGPIGETERATLQLEVNSLIEEFDRLTNATEFNGQKLLDGSLDGNLAANEHVVINVGLDSSESGQIDLNKVINLASTASTNIGIDAVSTETFESATDSLAIIEAALDTISGYRASIGATQNRFTRALSTLNVSIENLTAAYSAIQDTDVAEVLADLTKQQILVQSSTAMVGQANLIPEGVLSLLQ